MANDQVCRTARPLVERRESPASLPQLSSFLLLHFWNRLLTWEQKMLSGSNSTSIATTGLRSASSSEAILQGITCPVIYNISYMFIYATTPSESIFEGCFLPLKIYSHHCSPHKRSWSCLGRTSCSSRQRSQMVLIDRNKRWSEHWSRMKKSHLRSWEPVLILHLQFWNNFIITSNYLGAFVKARATRREEITYILSKFMRTMFTEPLQNNRFSSSFVFGDQTFWHFLFSGPNSILWVSFCLFNDTARIDTETLIYAGAKYLEESCAKIHTL